MKYGSPTHKVIAEIAGILFGERTEYNPLIAGLYKMNLMELNGLLNALNKLEAKK